MKEFYHDFKGYGRVPSQCKVKIIQDKLLGTFICFINIGEGTSVTNASEQLASEIVNKFNLTPSKCRFFETYEEYNHDSFDEIFYVWGLEKRNFTKHVANHPTWTPAPENIKEKFLKS